MTPENRKLKRKAKENQFPFDLGVKGRKTGLTLPELGERDENGLEPMDHLFSSPEKPSTTRLNGTERIDTTLSQEEDMETFESTIPDPVEALADRQRLNARLVPPKSKSPIKTYLNSPARRKASSGTTSSPSRGLGIESKAVLKPTSVQRKLEFSKSRMNASKYRATTTDEWPSKDNLSSSIRGSVKMSNGRKAAKPMMPEDFSDDDQEFREENVIPTNEENFHQIESNHDDESESQINESEATPEPQVQKKGRKKIRETVPTRPQKNETRKEEDQPKPLTQEESDLEEQRPSKRSRSSPNVPYSQKTAVEKKKVTTKPKARQNIKIATSKPQSSQIQRGPPLPKGKGLLILRRETPEDSNGILRTRSGRNSIKPLAFWSNEKVEFEDEEPPTKDLTADFVGRKIKHVIRAEEVVLSHQKKRTKSRSKKKRRRKNVPDQDSDEEEEDDDEDVEPWEEDPGRIIADIRTWDPNDPLGSEVEEIEEEIALSSAAIVTHEIVDASFRFAKTLTLPFFGAGMVDLPPGSEKKQKNSRKMQLAFFVFYGKVQVTVNDSVFRISKGGMWQVPRGNFYGIQNDYDRPARIFFSQGCEVSEDHEES